MLWRRSQLVEWDKVKARLYSIQKVQKLFFYMFVYETKCMYNHKCMLTI